MARYNFGGTNVSPFRGSAGRFSINPTAFSQPEDEYEDDIYADIINRYRGVLNREQPALQKFRDFSRSVPRREDYQPGFMGKLAAALAGFGVGMSNPQAGYETARSHVELPYKRALENFDIDRQLLGEEADFERQDRANQLKGLDYELEAYKNRIADLRENAKLKGQLGRWESQNSRDEAAVSEQDWRRTFDTSKFNSDREISLGNLNVNRQNAQTNRFNANTNAFNADTTRGRLNLDTGKFEHDKIMDFENLGLNSRRVREYESRDSDGNGTTFFSPQSQEKAEMMALEDIYTQFPAYRAYIDISNPGFPTINKTMNQKAMASPAFQKFLTELKGRKQAILTMQRSPSSSRYEIEEY